MWCGSESGGRVESSCARRPSEKSETDTSFTDAEVLDPHFIDTVQATVAVMMPFVRTLNDYIAPP